MDGSHGDVVTERLKALTQFLTRVCGQEHCGRYVDQCTHNADKFS
jgi:hypothetical protein